MNKRYGKGWRNESHRHFLAAKGIKTSKKQNKYYAYTPIYATSDLAPIAADGVGAVGASAVSMIPVMVPVLLAYGGAKYLKNRKDEKGSYFADKESTELMNFSSDDLRAFDKQLKTAENNGDNSFIFRDREVLTKYGHYVSEYLHSRGL